MIRTVASALAFASLLAACSKTVLVTVPPRLELKGYGTLGIVEFASNAERGVNVQATRQFQEQVQAAQPGTRFVELGSRDALLASVGGKDLDPATLRRIGEKYGVAAVFVGDIVYSEPKADLKVADLTKLDAGVRAEIRGDISSRLLETSTGASVWSNSAWVRRQIGQLSVSAERGVSGAVGKTNPRQEMVPALVHHLTQDFRPSSVRQSAK
jgi:hypothetical protein